LLVLKDDAEDEDLEEQFERFKKELGDSLLNQCNKKLYSIVREESLKAGEALLKDTRAQLSGPLTQDGIKIERELRDKLKVWVAPENLNGSAMSVDVSGKQKDYGPKFSDFALPALASIAYFPLGAMFLGGLSIIRWFKDSVSFCHAF
jgi:hypothetical protein